MAQRAQRAADGRLPQGGRHPQHPDRQRATHPIFAGSEAGKVLAAAGVRAVQSTPLVSVTGNVLGMLSTHYDQPFQPDEAELEAIDLIAGRAAYWLDQPTA